MFKPLYPNNNLIHHKGFDHEKLRDLLHSHNGKFILSYNNCETIREYYKDFEQIFPIGIIVTDKEKQIGKNEDGKITKNLTK